MEGDRPPRDAADVRRAIRQRRLGSHREALAKERSAEQDRRGRRLASAFNMLVLVTFLQIVVGLGAGRTHARNADRALLEFEQYGADQVLELEGGGSATVGELRERIAYESLLAYAVPVGIGIVLLVLCFVAWRRPVAGMAVAVGFYALVLLVDASIDVRTIGWMKGVILCSLVGGLVAAVAARAEERRAAERAQSAAKTAARARRAEATPPVE